MSSLSIAWRRFIALSQVEQWFVQSRVCAAFASTNWYSLPHENSTSAVLIPATKATLYPFDTCVGAGLHPLQTADMDCIIIPWRDVGISLSHFMVMHVALVLQGINHRAWQSAMEQGFLSAHVDGEVIKSSFTHDDSAAATRSSNQEAFSFPKQFLLCCFGLGLLYVCALFCVQIITFMIP